MGTAEKSTVFLLSLHNNQCTFDFCYVLAIIYLEAMYDSHSRFCEGSSILYTEFLCIHAVNIK